jgi:hypothetical protein
MKRLPVEGKVQSHSGKSREKGGVAKRNYTPYRKGKLLSLLETSA